MFGPIKRKPKEKEDPAEKQREQEETARVYAEFVRSFQADNEDEGQVFVRAGVINPNKTHTDESNVNLSSGPAKRSIWLPPPLVSLQNRPPCSSSITGAVQTSSEQSTVLNEPVKVVSSATTVSTELGKGIGGIDGLTTTASSDLCKPQTAQEKEIDSFLQEIKNKQRILDKRKQIRQLRKSMELLGWEGVTDKRTADSKINLPRIAELARLSNLSPQADETNVYISNLSNEVTKEFLYNEFQRFGRVKKAEIIESSPESGAVKNFTNYAIVCFEKRENAKIAINELSKAVFFGIPIKLSLADSPNSNIFYKPQYTSLPGFDGSLIIPSNNLTISQSIYVRVPENRKQKIVIDLVAQYIAEDGFPLEQLLIEKEGRNELFWFLFEKDTENAIYYRWRVYSFSQGDTTKEWRTEPFTFLPGGKEWIPPPKEYFEEAKLDKKSNFSNANDLLEGRTSYQKLRRSGHGMKKLDEENREKLEQILQNLTRERSSILQAMVFCLGHSDCALEISKCLSESLTIENTPIDAKISRMYLLSDLLHNSSCSGQPAWAYRSAIERYLPDIFFHHNKVLKSLSGRFTMQAMKERILKILKIWDEWAVYPPLFTKGLEASFLKDERLIQDVFESAVEPLEDDEHFDPTIDGEALPDKDFLSKFPFWIRENVREWNSADSSSLKNLCMRRGLSLNQEELYLNREKQTEYIPCATMRQLLIWRLVEYESYWRNKQIQNLRILNVVDSRENFYVENEGQTNTPSTELVTVNKEAKDERDVKANAEEIKTENYNNLQKNICKVNSETRVGETRDLEDEDIFGSHFGPTEHSSLVSKDVSKK